MHRELCRRVLSMRVQLRTTHECDIIAYELAQYDIFAELSRAKLRQLAVRAHLQVQRAFDIVCRANDPGDSFYIVFHGHCVHLRHRRVQPYIASRAVHTHP